MAIVQVEYKHNPKITIGKRAWLFMRGRWQRRVPEYNVSVDYGVPNTGNATFGVSAPTKVAGYGGATFSWTWSHTT